MKKVCNYSWCHRLIGIREKYCEEHKFKKKRDFNKYRMKRTDKEEQKFYKNGEWVKNREQVKAKDVGLYLICLSKKRFTKSDVIHHTIELKENKELRVDENNLIALCNSYHRTIHGKYKKGMVTKLETLKKLRELVSKGAGGI